MTSSSSSSMDDSQVLAKNIAQYALNKKSENTISIDVRGVTNIADFFIICSADTDIQVKAIADSIRRGTDHKPWRVEGYEHLNWVLLDYVDVVVHIFKTQEREYYNLESLWSDAPIVEYNDNGELTNEHTVND